jgi:AraC-like DNA-binding protein/mannose-6-phosphate isomerase-like protein (cupin superfamily)
MKQGQDITAQFPGIFIIHQKISGNSVAEHKHKKEHEIFLPLQGEIRIQVHSKTGDRLLKAGPGRMIYLPPQTEHSFSASSSSQGERLIFIVQDSKWTKSLGGRFEPAAAPVSQLCKELLFHLLIHPKTRASKALLETLIQTVSEMIEFSSVEAGNLVHLHGKTSDSRLKNALALIREKHTEKLSIETLAKSTGLSVRNLNRLFIEELSLTPKQLATMYRIETAKALLKSGRSVTDVALEVGYSSVSQFITTFRVATGQLPSEFR